MHTAGGHRRLSRRSTSAVLLPAAPALALALAAAARARAVDVASSRPLECTTPLVVNGVTFDLSPLAALAQPLTLTTSLSTPPSITRTSISISLCARLPAPPSSTPAEDACPSSSRICQVISSTKGTGPEVVNQVIPLSTEDFGYQVSLGDRDGSGGEQNLEWEFQGPTYAGRKQTVEIEMVCDPSASTAGGKLEWRGYESLDGKAKVHWRTAVACPSKRSDGTPSSGSQPAQRGTWGSFSWFILLLVLGFIIYFVVGTYQNHQRYGVAEIPHRDFWREAPYLVQDAGRHAWKSISGQGGSKGGAYEPV